MVNRFGRRGRNRRRRHVRSSCRKKKRRSAFQIAKYEHNRILSVYLQLSP